MKLLCFTPKTSTVLHVNYISIKSQIRQTTNRNKKETKDAESRTYAFFISFSLAMLCSIWDLNSLIRDWTHFSCSISTVLRTTTAFMSVVRMMKGVGMRRCRSQETSLKRWQLTWVKGRVRGTWGDMPQLWLDVREGEAEWVSLASGKNTLKGTVGGTLEKRLWL